MAISRVVTIRHTDNQARRLLQVFGIMAAIFALLVAVISLADGLFDFAQFIAIEAETWQKSAISIIWLGLIFTAVNDGVNFPYNAG